MARRWLLAGLAPVLAGAALLLTPSTSQAWGWGGWHGGWGGGWGGYYGGWYSPYHTSYGYGWGGYPMYGGYGYTVPNYSTYWGGYYPTYQYPTYQVYSQPSSNYTTTGATNGKQANVRVEVPANAEVWFSGFKTSQTGTDRMFHSPPLEPKGNYKYEVRARWMENGKVVDRTRNIPIHAGETVTVDFMGQTLERNAAIPPPVPQGETPTSTGP